MGNTHNKNTPLKKNIVLMKNEIMHCFPQNSKWEAGVFVHLYYLDTLDFFVKYINNIPDYIDIYVSYSEILIKEKLTTMLQGQNNIYFVSKENRGRDISSFLVAFKEYYHRYQYVCFVHDKKEKTKEEKKTTDEWIYSLWENMLASEEYINNILWRFETDKRLGLLVPPYLVSERSNFAVDNLWYDNYENTLLLAKKLKLNCDIGINKSPITQGTCFWARTDALRKLTDYEWKYEDFPSEPLPSDGVINHAVERVLSYVAQDAGYVTGWVMTDEYANDYIDNLLSAYKSSYRILNDELGINNLLRIKHRKIYLEKLESFINCSNSIYIYGAGKRARYIYKMFRKLNILPKAFVVSQKVDSQQYYLGIKVVQFDELKLTSETRFVIGVGAQLKDSIIAILHERGVKDDKILVLE